MPRSLLSVLLLAAGISAQDPAEAMAALVADPHLAGARVGVVVRDLESDRELCAHDADQGFMTASNMKLISSSVALLTLGPDYRFKTVLWARGDIEGGVLRGDLELQGSGDPTLGGRHEADAAAPFRRIAARLKALGIEAITGNVLGNDDCQPDEIMGEGWSWAYQGAGYAAQVSGLCFAENCVGVTVTPTAPGEAPDVAATPKTSYLGVSNHALVVAGKPDSPLLIDRRRAANEIVVTGEVGAEEAPKTRVLSVENPTAYAAHMLRETLIEAGIEVGGVARELDDRPATPPLPSRSRALAEHVSPPLSEILVTLNKVSQNLYAEQMIRAASRSATGASDMPAAAAHAAETLRVLGVDTTGLVIADGSGLTRLNLVRPQQFASLLAGMWRHPQRDLFVSTLPIAGVDGTLQKRFPADDVARGRVRAKTGYISRVVALSGYVPRPGNGRPPLVFSVLTNNFVCETADAKAAVDRFVSALAQHAGWTAHAPSQAK